MPEHFAHPPNWEWYVILYLFLGGIAGGTYALGTLLRLVGTPRDEGAARAAFLIGFPALLLCPILLTLDLGRPERFWHMLIDSAQLVPSFKYWSPMSLGAWVLAVFGIFSTVSFFEALLSGGHLRFGFGRWLPRFMGGGPGRVFMIVGSLLGLYICGYTGVLLSVSNQPLWSDSWTLGGLFLASALSVSAAAIIAYVWWTRRDEVAALKLSEADRYFLLLEILLLIVFVATLGSLGTHLLSPWMLVALLGILLPAVLHFRLLRVQQLTPLVVAVLVLIGGVALRAAIVFGAQA